MSINEIQDQIIAEFELFDNWNDKYEYIIELGKKLKHLDDRFKNDEYKIKGCQSNVWLSADMEGSNLIFTADSESVIVKGLISLLIRVLSGQNPKDIVASDLYFMDKIGMMSHLAQTRSNGLLSMLKQMKFYALAYDAKLAK